MSNIRIKEERIDRLMDTAEYEIITTFRKCTIVTAKLENGFILTESSACVDEANYDMGLGIRLCKKKIRERLRELEGYLLQNEVDAAVKRRG